jgi:hypothetical protein
MDTVVASLAPQEVSCGQRDFWEAIALLGSTGGTTVYFSHRAQRGIATDALDHPHRRLDRLWLAGQRR